MKNKIMDRIHSEPAAAWFYIVSLTAIAVLWGINAATGKYEIWLYLALAVMFLFAFRPNSLAHKPKAEDFSRVRFLCTAIAAIITISVCTSPMDKFPLWNGENAHWRDQYEEMAESLLQGRLDIDCCEAEELAALKNPYDRNARQEAGIEYFHTGPDGNGHAHWDHAYYNGHFYMYFGIVPVFLTFLPYRIITGQPLTTYRATQFFVALAIIGIFLLFYALSKLFFKKLPYSVYLICSVAFSVMSVWFSTAQPALYCTPIAAAIALEIWSIFFFLWAVYDSDNSENEQIVLAAVGALFGALAFGCRPPIAIANIVVLPMLITFIKQRKLNFKLLGKLVLAAMPYFVVGILLMLYNYARFEDPFEFGQAYQLTVTDQSNYSIALNKDTFIRLINEGLSSFFSIQSFTDSLPYISGAGGVFFNFPMLLLCALIFIPSVAKKLKEKKLLGVVIALLVSVLIITALDIMWSPYILERYHMDVYFILGIATFFVLGSLHDTSNEKRQGIICTIALTLAVCTIIAANLLCIDTIGLEDLPLARQ